MAFENIYNLEFKSFDDNTYNLYFQKNLSSTPTTVELDGTSNPVQIEYPEFDRFEVVRGSGLTINLLSTGSFALTNLFDAGDQTIKMRLQKNGSDVWWGWLENEQYEEPYTENSNYPVTLYANDGFSLLDRKLYVDSSGNNYTGISSQWVVLKRCLDKLELLSDIGDVVVAMSTTSDDVTIDASGSIFHSTYVKNENYYNEDGEPETCRKVLEMVLSEYGAFIQMVGNDILISDVQTIADASSTISFKKFHSSTMIYWKTENDLTLTDINDLGYYQTGGTYKLIPGTNNLEVRYNKYKTVIGEIETGNSDYITTGSWTHETSGDNDFYYQYIDSHSQFIFPSGSRGRILGMKNDVDSTPEYHVEIINPSAGGGNATTRYDTCAITSFDKYINGNSWWYLRIRGKSRMNSRTDPYNSSTTDNDSEDAQSYYFGCVFTIGDYSFNVTTQDWSLTSGLSNLEKTTHIHSGERQDNTVNVWHDFKTIREPHYTYPIIGSTYVNYPETDEEGVLITLKSGINGFLTMSFTNTMNTMEEDNWYLRDETIEGVSALWLKDIEVDVVKKGDLSEDEDDAIYKGYISSSWVKDKNEYTIYHGNSYVETPCDNGALMRDNGSTFSYITEWTRNGVTDSIENLLLRSYLSNEGRATKQLNVTLNNTTGKIIPRLVDETYLSGSIFMACGCNIDLTDESMQVTLKEIKQDVEDFS